MYDFDILIGGQSIPFNVIYSSCKSIVRNHNVPYKDVIYRFFTLPKNSRCKEEDAAVVAVELERLIQWMESNPKQEPDVSLFDGLHNAGYISDADYAKLEAQSTYVPRCPVCGSPDIKKISGLSRAISFEAFGFASSTARAQRQCRNCGYKF